MSRLRFLQEELWSVRKRNRKKQTGQQERWVGGPVPGHWEGQKPEMRAREKEMMCVLSEQSECQEEVENQALTALQLRCPPRWGHVVLCACVVLSTIALDNHNQN